MFTASVWWPCRDLLVFLRRALPQSILVFLSLRPTRTKNEVDADRLGRNYFHYLVPEGNGLESSDDEWHGKLVAMERTIKSEAQKTDRSLKEQLALVHWKMDELTAQCSRLDKEATENKLQEKNWRCHVEERMDRIESVLGQILQKLDANGPCSD